LYFRLVDGSKETLEMPKNTNHKPRPHRGSNRAKPKPRNGRVAERVLLTTHVAKGVQRSYAAFLRALPELLRQPGNPRSWAAFHGDDFVAVGKTETQLYRTCKDLGFEPDSFYVGWIVPHSDRIEEVDPSLFEFEDSVPSRRK
jgi:hypothetical protein